MTTHRITRVDQLIAFSVGDRQFEMSGAQVLEAARRAISEGLPPAASNYVSWVIEVDGQVVGMKWLFGLVTGLPHSAFQTANARMTFGRMGLVSRKIDAAPKPETTRPARPSASSHTDPMPHAASLPRRYVVLDAELVRLRNFLRGRSERPSDEKLCDWVHFCYTFELYAEGCELFRLVDPTSVNPWYYERSKRLAAICTMKTTRKP